ncbi:hypothetical protein LZ32DRAFT_618419 [Colletotrichum eremochloae]|nr:hypothetical protein LZ32DRAFT_618419 [Colletotrichum eremochloae]
MRQDLNNKVSPQAIEIRKMIESNATSNALLTQAAERLDAATKALMSEKAEFALAKEQLLQKGTEFASINVEMEKAMAAVEELVAIHVCSGMGVFNAQELSSFQKEIQNERNELEAVKSALNDVWVDINPLDEKFDGSKHGVKVDGQHGLQQKVHDFDNPNTNDTINTQAKEREYLKASVIKELKKELKTDLKAELENMVIIRVDDLKAELMEDLKYEFILCDLKYELKDELKAELKGELKTKLQKKLSTLVANVRADLKYELIDHVESNIKTEFIKHEIKDAVSHKMIECVKPLDHIYEEMKEALHRIDTKEQEFQSTLVGKVSSLQEKHKKFEKETDDRLISIEDELGMKMVQSWDQEYRSAKKTQAMNIQEPHVKKETAIEPPCPPTVPSMLQGCNNTTNNKHQKKYGREPRAKDAAHTNLASKKSEGSIVSRCVAANACDWGAKVPADVFVTPQESVQQNYYPTPGSWDNPMPWDYEFAKQKSGTGCSKPPTSGPEQETSESEPEYAFGSW